MIFLVRVCPTRVKISLLPGALSRSDNTPSTEDLKSIHFEYGLLNSSLFVCTFTVNIFAWISTFNLHLIIV